MEYDVPCLFSELLKNQWVCGEYKFWLKIIEIQRKYKILQATSNQYMAPLAASI